jgi:lactoylglutathione lyase
MANGAPADRTQDTDFMFTKLLVDDLEKAAAFYASVCGLVELQRLDAEIAGRPVSEICYKPTYPGGPLLILAKFHGAPKPANDELILGFSTKDLESFLKRVEEAGGHVVQQIQQDPRSGLRHAFFEDIEGHLVQISSTMG